MYFKLQAYIHASYYFVRVCYSLMPLGNKIQTTLVEIHLIQLLQIIKIENILIKTLLMYYEIQNNRNLDFTRIV